MTINGSVLERINEELRERKKVKAELFLLKHRKAYKAGKNIKSIGKSIGSKLLKASVKTSKKVGPLILKQAKLIREQQLRDEALERALKKKTKRTRKTPKRRRKKR